MHRSLRQLAARRGLLAAAILAPTAHAQLIGAANTGWYESTGEHSPTNPNHTVGGGWLSLPQYLRFRSVLHPVADPRGDVLRWNPISGYSGSGSEVFSLYGATGFSPSAISGGTSAVDIYDALVAGPVLGSVTVTGASNGTYVDIDLDGAAALGLLGLIGPRRLRMRRSAR